MFKKLKILKYIIIICFIILFLYITQHKEEFEDNVKKVFITFGAGGDNYIQAGERLKKQVIELNVFDEVMFYSDDYLKKDSSFWNKHSNFIENNKRGYGYWIWKPYIIKKTMEKMKDGDMLLYADCGCEIDINRKNELINDFELVKKYYIIGSSTGEIEKKWNKMDLIEKLNANDDKYINTIQKQAGVNLFYICKKTRNLVNEWYELCCDYHLIDDSPSILSNAKEFIEHRHDQSIFSLLCKKNNIISNKEISIEIVRNKTGNTKL
jgi:hypothetical protein